jgi:hypothetical protein
MRYEYSSVQKRLPESPAEKRDVEKYRDRKAELSGEIALLAALVGLVCGAILTTILH